MASCFSSASLSSLPSSWRIIELWWKRWWYLYGSAAGCFCLRLFLPIVVVRCERSIGREYKWWTVRYPKVAALVACRLHSHNSTHTQSGFYGASSTASDESRAPNAVDATPQGKNLLTPSAAPASAPAPASPAAPSFSEPRRPGPSYVAAPPAPRAAPARAGRPRPSASV